MKHNMLSVSVGGAIVNLIAAMQLTILPVSE